MQMQWRCDYCLVASFPTFEAASQHELTCPARLAQVDRGGGGARPPGVSSHVNVIEDRSRSPSPANPSPTNGSQPGTNVTIKNQEVAEERPATVWECDICNEYKSHNYEDVVLHEKTCVAVDATGGDDNDAMDTSGEIRKKEKKNKDRSNKSPKRTRWRCDVCSIRTFDTFEEAVEHEKTCTGAKVGDEIKRNTKRSKKEDRGSAIKAPKSHDDIKASAFATCKPVAVDSKQSDVESYPVPVSVTIRSDAKITHPVATEKVQVMPPKKNQTKSNSNEARLVDSLAVRTCEMDAIKASSTLEKIITKEETPQCTESMNQNHSRKSKDDEESKNPSIAKFTLAFITKATISLAPLALAFTYLPRDLHDKLDCLTTLPSFAVLAASPLILTAAAYSIFSLALVVTHQGVHHHKSRGFVIDILMAVRDTISPPKIDYLNWDEPCLTLREYLNHPDGFSMAFAPAFFGFFAYFGALIALEEETRGSIVPKINGDKCGLKSVSGASAGAMAAVMLASGIQPRVAAEYVSKFSWGMVADPFGLFGLVKGNKFEEFMRSFIKEAAARTEEKEGDVMLEDALVPIAVSGFDLRSLRGTILSRGCMAKAARASAGFPGLFQPVSWEGDRKELLIDGGIRDGLGLNGLSAFVSNKMRVINMAVGDFGISGPNGVKDLPTDIEAESLVSIAILNTPMCSPWAMANGPKAVETARKAMASMLDTPMQRGTSINHYTLRVDASKWLE